MIYNILRCALDIISGIIIYNFGIAERLRTLRYPIFTGGVVKVNGSGRAGFLRKHLRGAATTVALRALSCENAMPDSPQAARHCTI